MLSISIATLNTLLNLKQCMLHSARVLLIYEILLDVSIGQFTTKPGEVPGEECAANKQNGKDQNRTRRANPSRCRSDNLDVWIVSVVFH
jgi:hypothetical protein